jgi:hypothetical protein
MIGNGMFGSVYENLNVLWPHVVWTLSYRILLFQKKAGSRYFSLHSVQTTSTAYPASYSMDTGALPERKVARM